MTSLGGLLTPYVLTGVRRRAALTIAALLGCAQYLVRVWSPPQLRALAAESIPEHRALGLAIAWVLWMRITRALAWRLVLGADVRFLRHLPIAPWRWRVTHALQLALLDLTVAGIAGYGLAPRFLRDRSGALAWWIAAIFGALAWRVGQCVWASRSARGRIAHAVAATAGFVLVVVIDDPNLALTIAAGLAAWAVARLGRPFAEPSVARHRTMLGGVRGPAIAIARLWLGVAWHQDGAFVRIAIAGQLALVALSTLACVRVGVLDPSGAIAAVHLFTIAAAGLATWSAVRVERRIAVDRWALDPLIGARTTELLGRLLAAGVLALPVLAGTIAAAIAIDHPLHARSFAAAAAAVLWSASAAVGITVRAQQRDRLHEPPIGAQLGRLLVVGTAGVVFGAAAVLLAAIVELAIAWRRWPAADLMRRRRYRAPGEAERD